ncbi:WD40 repeat-like protein [Alternaria alternata]|nr:WD40 repeat-like protein [Alternaria alternata]
MSSSHAPTSPPAEDDPARTIVYDPSDPFWRETDDEYDDDMDFVPAEEGTDDNDEGEADLSFHDAAERLSNLSGVEIAFEYTDDNDDDDDDDDEDEENGEDDEDGDENEEENDDAEEDEMDNPRQPIMITREQIMQLLGHAGLGRIFATDFIPRSALRRRRLDEDDEDEDEDDGYDPLGSTRTSGRRRRPRGIDLFEKVPSEQGQELMQGGNFGTNPRSQDTLKRKKKLAYNIMRRELGIGGDGRQKNSTRLLRQEMIPESVADTIIHYNARCYSGQFSDDGNFFFSCAQDFKIWSIRFSGDGREIVAGTGDSSVYVYDIERRQSVLRIPGHQDDVNAVCFGDTQSPHILYSGSDDTTLKVWDRRSMGDGREAGVFLGHTEGLTYVDSKGDGRYVLSNGKDQTAKLWDLRKMMSKEKADGIDPNAYTNRFEYRSNAYDFDEYRPHPHDCSLVTFRGHKVLKTLIRCHFSPPGSTDSRYVYSGSYDGSVYIWNMDATIAGKVDVLKATRNSRPRDPDLLAGMYEHWGRNEGRWQTCVRDASWHPNVPMIAATSWNGWGTSQGTCTVHTWNDGLEEDEAEPKIGRRVNAQLQHDERLYTSPEGRARRHPMWYEDMMNEE